MKELSQRVNNTIDTKITIDDFIQFFKKRKERTASSPSGRHMGIYKVIAQLAQEGRTIIAQTIVNIINIALITSRPLKRWKHSAQVMNEKGKGIHVENLRIIQLCEADLNFALNIIWGYRLTRHALKHKALHKSQYALPGLTCQSASWNKLLFCDLTRQTFTPSIMTDYDAATAFDRVLHTMSIIVCRRLGLPPNTSLFMYNLLHNMEFHLITGFGPSLQSFSNNEDPRRPGQGIPQGSSSAAPIYNFNSDVSLHTYSKNATGATFIHPITGQKITEHATQYVDDKTETANINELQQHVQNDSTKQRDSLFAAANENSNLWANILWTSGGSLNPNKCFCYYLDPTFNHTTQGITYKSIKQAPGQLTLTPPDNNISTTITRFEPREGKRSLGVIMAPDGNCHQQIKQCIEKAKQYIGKIKHSKLSNRAKWTATTTILEPGVTYPLMATLCSQKEMESIERILISFKCHALGLNPHFPRAVLYGPMLMGGLELPSTISKISSTRINYFLYHTRLNTDIGHKLDASRTFLQMEIGLFEQVLTTSHILYGHLGTRSLIKTIWAETEPNDLYLQAASREIAWSPIPQGFTDVAIMEIAIRHYNNEQSNMINRYRLYLQLFSVYDVIIYNKITIHPDILNGKRPESRQTLYFWAQFKRPPKKYLELWRHFLTNHIQPILDQIEIRWNTDCLPNYHTTFILSYTDRNLYQKLPDVGYLKYKPKPRTPQNTTYFKNAELVVEPLTEHDFSNVDESFGTKSIIVLGESNINSHGSVRHDSSIQNKLNQLYSALPKSLQQLCGQTHLPTDGGVKMIQNITETNSKLQCASDASLKDNNCTHAWVITTSNIEHLNDPDMHLSGYGAVDGIPQALSSARGELQGQTAALIMSKMVLEAHQSSLPIHMSGDNQGVQKKCAEGIHNRRIRDHRQHNMDLYLKYKAAAKGTNKTTSWVKSHQDSDTPWNTFDELRQLKLPHDVTLNVWCDKKANAAHQNVQSDPAAEVFPSEKWAIYSNYPEKHKITASFEASICRTMYHDQMQRYINKKYKITEVQLEECQQDALQKYLSRQKIQARANTIKLLHRWLPTNEFLHK